MGPVNIQRRHEKHCDCCDSAEARRSEYSELLSVNDKKELKQMLGALTCCTKEAAKMLNITPSQVLDAIKWHFAKKDR